MARQGPDRFRWPGKAPAVSEVWPFQNALNSRGGLDLILRGGLVLILGGGPRSNVLILRSGARFNSKRVAWL